MKCIALSVFLVLAVGLADAASVSHHLLEEWELFKVINYIFIVGVLANSNQLIFVELYVCPHSTLIERATLNQKRNSVCKSSWTIIMELLNTTLAIKMEKFPTL